MQRTQENVMSTTQLINFDASKGGNWIRLRTLVFLRWWAILGQTSALIVAQRLYNLNLEIGLCFLVVGVAIISNLVAVFIFPQNKRLSEVETLLVVLFDMIQLGLMLYFTGGLNNPFSILIVGPVIVSASALSSRSTLFLGFTAIMIVSILTKFHLPLRMGQGAILQMPDIFLFGNWIAIVIAVIFLGVYSRWIVSEMRAMSNALQATQMALSREQKLTDLGGVVAAAAHELGTPLATIKLTSAELADELADKPDLFEDAMLICEQTDRCRDILRSMGRAGKDDTHMHSAPIMAILQEAAEPHAERGKNIQFSHGDNLHDSKGQPIILRRPEVIHGVRNLIQNAVDFAHDTVWIDCNWTHNAITITITDNGSGYPQHLLGRIGEPFMRRRSSGTDPQRPEYEGMGLGLFIAKTLLERSGADLTFANGSDVLQSAEIRAERCGACVKVIWPRNQIDAQTDHNHEIYRKN